MSRVLNISGIWIDCQYVKFLNFQVYTEFTYFCKYSIVLNKRRHSIMEWFWIFQDCKYARFFHMQALHKFLNMPECGWIMREQIVLNMPGQSFTGFWICHSSKYSRARNMARLRICEGYTGCWICLNEAEYALIICQNML